MAKSVRLGKPSAVAATLPGAAADARLSIMLLDLSGDEAAARRWASEFPHAEQIQLIHKADLKWRSKREALRKIRSLSPDLFCVFTADVNLQSARGALLLFLAFAGARRIIVGDWQGRIITRSRMGAVVIEGFRMAFEILIGYGLIIPFSWLTTLILGAVIPILKTGSTSREARSNPAGHANDNDPPSGSAQSKALTILYLRATPVGSASAGSSSGGMFTHVAGFTRGVLDLGHTVRFLTTSEVGIPTERVEVEIIRPSLTLSSTRALFELWNNLVFTLKSVLVSGTQTWAAGREHFIYQRYSRFNWTGVVLSVLRNKPLVLEYNGSEVWVSRNWDPVGHISLLKRFERLNQSAADLIITVSDAERRNLIAAGVDPGRVVVNPNGVDVDEFRPGCGGETIRQKLAISERIVVGFLGSFAPFHGTRILAQAVVRLRDDGRYHFLFIGDGDMKPATEAIISAGGCGSIATFSGRVAHNQVPAYLDACDILVSPHERPADGSEFFGSPTKLFEYLAMGRPVIASRLGQIADIITDGENGILAEAGDVDALVERIRRLGDDPTLRKAIGKAARQTVSAKYTWRHNARRVLDAFEMRFSSGQAA